MTGRRRSRPRRPRRPRIAGDPPVDDLVLLGRVGLGRPVPKAGRRPARLAAATAPLWQVTKYALPTVLGIMPITSAAVRAARRPTTGRRCRWAAQPADQLTAFPPTTIRAGGRARRRTARPVVELRISGSSSGLAADGAGSDRPAAAVQPDGDQEQAADGHVGQLGRAVAQNAARPAGRRSRAARAASRPRSARGRRRCSSRRAPRPSDLDDNSYPVPASGLGLPDAGHVHQRAAAAEREPAQGVRQA